MLQLKYRNGDVMKKVFNIILIITLFLPLVVNGLSYDSEKARANKYIENISTYERYIINRNDMSEIPFEYTSSGQLRSSLGFEKGGFISIYEYKITKVSGKSYLYKGSNYWTMSESGEKAYVVDKEASENKSNSNPSRVVEYVKKETEVSGSGTSTDPYIFVPKYKVTIHARNGIVEENENGKYYSGLSGARITTYPEEGYSYISNNCNGEYNKEERKLKITNITKDIDCSIIYSFGVYKLTLGEETEGVVPREIYLKYSDRFYRENETTTIINKLDTIPTKPGYKFKGIGLNEEVLVVREDGKIDTRQNRVVSENTKLDVIWEGIEYKVTFNANGGENLSFADKQVRYGSAYGSLPTIRKSGYKFNGWYTSESGGNKKEETTIVNTIGDHTLYAQFTVCPAGTYSTSDGLACAACPSGMTSDEGSTSKNNCKITCNAGYYLKSTESTCKACPAGSKCTGKVCNYSESDDCGIEKCTGEYFSYGTGNTTCSLCAVGSVVNSNNTGCTACQGRTTTAAGQSSCNRNCDNEFKVTEWKNSTWTNNSTNNVCSINYCQEGYKVENNKCVPSKLYTALEYEVETDSGYALRYWDAHNDSYSGNATKNIYFYYADNDTNGSYIANNKNNVIFGGYCWIMLRTTDTGGTKIMYNGAVNNGKCDRTGESTIIGNSNNILNYNVNGNYTNCGYSAGANIDSLDGSNTSIAYVGYMYDESKAVKTKKYNSAGTLFYAPGYNTNNSLKAAFDNALMADDVNKTNSNAKTIIENWYSSNLNKNGYPNYLEDTIFCNDRRYTIPDGFFSGSNGIFVADDNKRIMFSSSWSWDLSCVNDTDKFSTQNPKAKLTYPIALPTAPELRRMNNLKIINNGYNFWTMTPNYFIRTTPRVNGVFLNNNSISESYLCRTFGLRPVVSIKYAVNIASGKGSKTNPYVLTLDSVH